MLRIKSKTFGNQSCIWFYIIEDYDSPLLDDDFKKLGWALAIALTSDFISKKLDIPIANYDTAINKIENLLPASIRVNQLTHQELVNELLATRNPNSACAEDNILEGMRLGFKEAEAFSAVLKYKLNTEHAFRCQSDYSASRSRRLNK